MSYYQNSKDLSKNHLYEGVKALIEAPADHIHLDQPKLYTLFSLAFQSLLYRASKDPGFYIIRVEDSFLVEKIARKAKDASTRKFISRLATPRKLRFENSVFFLDYFNLSSWSLTKDLPGEKLKFALIVKNTSSRPMIDEIDYRALGEDFYLSTLVETIPKTITIAYQQSYQQLEPLRFDFIPQNEELAAGVRITSDLSLDDSE